MIKLEICSYGNTYGVWLPVYKQPNITNQIEHMVETISINDRRITQPCRRSWMSIPDMLFAEWTLHKGPAPQLAQRSTSFSLSMTFDNRITSHCWVMLRNDYARVLCVKLFVSILVWIMKCTVFAVWICSICCVVFGTFYIFASCMSCLTQLISVYTTWLGDFDYTDELPSNYMWDGRDSGPAFYKQMQLAEQ